MTIPTGLLIFKDLEVRGYWQTRWSNQAPREEKVAMLHALASHATQGHLSHTRATFFDLETEWREALESAAASSHRASGKPILKCGVPSRQVS